METIRQSFSSGIPSCFPVLFTPRKEILYVDYREIQVSEVLLVHLDPRVLRVRQEYRGFKA